MKTVTASLKKGLTPVLAAQFGTLKAKRRELDQEEKGLVPRIKLLMPEDEACVRHRTEGTNGRVTTYVYAPEESPYQLEFSQYQAVDVSWKDEFERLYVKQHGQKAFDNYVAQLPLKDCEKLDAKPNPNFKNGKNGGK